MLDQIKSFVLGKLSEHMGPNSLGDSDTKAAAEEGANSVIDTITEDLKGGNVDELKSLFSDDGNATEDSPIFQKIKTSLSGILQKKGMAPEEAEKEAASAAPGLIEGLKAKFASEDEADSGFDLGNIAGLLTGGVGGLVDKAKSLFS